MLKPLLSLIASLTSANLIRLTAGVYVTDGTSRELVPKNTAQIKHSVTTRKPLVFNGSVLREAYIIV